MKLTNHQMKDVHEIIKSTMFAMRAGTDERNLDECNLMDRDELLEEANRAMRHDIKFRNFFQYVISCIVRIVEEEQA